MANQEEKRAGAALLVLTRAAAGLCVTVLILALSALLVSGGMVSTGVLLPGSVTAVFLGAFAGGFLAARRHGSRRIPIGAVVGLALFVFMFFVGMMFSFPPAGHTLFVLLAAVCGGVAGGFLAAPRAKRHRR